MKTKPSVSLHRIQKQFPHVQTIVDAIKPITITVTKNDSKIGLKKDPTECALARACKRQEHADGVIIGIGISWVIKGKIATRYLTSVSVGREITSFDRHHDFASGNYRLMSIPSSRKLGLKGGAKKSKTKSGRKLNHLVIHRTQNIRTLAR